MKLGLISVSLFAALVPFALAACSKSEKSAGQVMAAPAKTLAPSMPPPDAKTTRFAIDAQGSTTIDMPAPKERIKAGTKAAGGALDVALSDLGATRGEVRADLTTLTTTTFGDKDKDDAQTVHARTWLEAVVEGKVLEDNRWAVLAIRSIDGLSAADVSTVAPVREGEDDVRTVTMTVHGELLIHARKVSKEARVEARFFSPAGSSAQAAPARIALRSLAPMRVVLAEHEIMPRDTFGSIAQGSLHLLGTKVADTADVSIAFTAAAGAPVGQR